jgi:hypothetical protein
MNRLPGELVNAIILHCVSSFSKNNVLELRLVCRLFNDILKPYACQTIDLDFSRLSKTSGRRRPRIDALQTVGYYCKSIFIDLMVVRDDSECLMILWGLP